MKSSDVTPGTLEEPHRRELVHWPFHDEVYFFMVLIREGKKGFDEPRPELNYRTKKQLDNKMQQIKRRATSSRDWKSQLYHMYEEIRSSSADSSRLQRNLLTFLQELLGKSQLSTNLEKFAVELSKVRSIEIDLSTNATKISDEDEKDLLDMLQNL